MPFANKFIKTMEFPKPGDTLNGFVVEEVEVGHIGGHGYRYPIRMVITGVGGKQKARFAVRDLFAAKRTCFSGYGNPYQLTVGQYTVESLGDRRYEVTADGRGFRMYLDMELRRFYRYLKSAGALKKTADDAVLLEEYLKEYQAETDRKNKKTDWF